LPKTCSRHPQIWWHRRKRGTPREREGREQQLARPSRLEGGSAEQRVEEQERSMVAWREGAAAQ
jgi:hypothetical protein